MKAGLKKAIQRDYGRAYRGVRGEEAKPGRGFERLNVIGAYCAGETVAEWRYTYSTTKDFFELWFEGYLAANVTKGSTIILDNASFHSKTNLTKIAAAAQLKDIIFTAV